MCVLLVEDEPFIREILVDELDFHGFDVCAAESGDQAAELIENPPKVFSVLITDIRMPGQRNGVDVARMIRQRHPRLPIVYATRRPDAVTTPLGPHEALVTKPYRPAEIVAIVRRLLAVD